MVRTLTVLTLALVLCAASAGADDSHRHDAPEISDPRFEFLKRLVGSWVAESDHEGMSEGVFEFRLTAGGSAIEEREMVGTPMEMVTLYYMEGGELEATHYCMLGNRPHATAAGEITRDTLRFACAGKPGNAGSHDDEHVHAWSIRLAGDGRLHYSAQLAKDGEVTQTPSFVLTRKTETASR